MSETAYDGDVMKWRWGGVVGFTRLGGTFTPIGKIERDSGPMTPAYDGQFAGLRAAAPSVRPNKSPAKSKPKTN